MRPLLDAILEYIPSPKGDLEGPAQILFSSLEYDEYVGRIGVGRVERGEIKANTPYVLCRQDGTTENVKFSKIYQFEGLKRVETPIAKFGDLVSVAGIADLNIGETACDPDCIEPLPFVKIDEPTISMNFMVNDSPFAGREGKYVTSRNLRERLFKEVETNVSMRVEETDSMDTFKVSGRGELHLSILIEQMRRQNYEFQVSSPQVIYKEIDGVKCEPIERMVADVPQAYAGAVIEKIGRRRGVLEKMEGSDRVRLEFLVPSRGLFGYRSEFMTDTRGEGIMSAVFEKYEPFRGDIPHRSVGALIVYETGETTQYGLFYTQERGTLFVGSQVPVYAGMICGANSRPGDIVCNVCRKKHVTNTRNAASAEDSLRLVSVHPLTLEECLEFIDDDELLEITPKSLRMRKRELNHEQRARAAYRAKQ